MQVLADIASSSRQLDASLPGTLLHELVMRDLVLPAVVVSPEATNHRLMLNALLGRHAVSYTHLDVYKRQVDVSVGEAVQGGQVLLEWA